jgi:hypothetical protein
MIASGGHGQRPHGGKKLMPTYKVRLTWQAVTEVVVEAENTIDAQEVARKKAAADRPVATTITDARVLSVETREGR